MDLKRPFREDKSSDEDDVGSQVSESTSSDEDDLWSQFMQSTSSDKNDLLSQLMQIISLDKTDVEAWKNWTETRNSIAHVAIPDFGQPYPKRTIKVQALNGETCTVEAYRFDRAKDVKAKACEKLRLSTERRTLVYNGKELDDMSDLSSIDTSVECKFQLLPKTGLVTIKVQALNGETCTVEAYRFDRAKDVKAKACEKLRLSTERRTLVYNGKELDDMSDLSSIDTSVECKFQLLPKTGLGLVDSVKSLFEYFRNGAHQLVEWFPDFFMDMSRALTEKDLSRISQAIGSGWKHLGAELGISQAEIDQICEDNRKTSMKIFNMLRQWSIQASVNATVNTLHNAMKNCRKVTFDMKAIERVFAGI